MLGPGDYFGEMGPLFGLPRSATARAAEDTEVTGYSVKDFREKLGIERLGQIVSVAKTRALSARRDASPSTTRHRERRRERVVAVLHVHGLVRTTRSGKYFGDVHGDAHAAV